MMETAARDSQFLGADAFLRTDQTTFGSAWRYELVCGTIIAYAAPTPEHGVILGNLAGELYNRLRGHAECRAEVGSGAASDYEQRDTARIPDVLIRCGKRPRMVFEVVSPSELSYKRQRDQKRSDLQAVDGVQEIVEIYQDEVLAHAYRRHGDAWVFESIADPNGSIGLRSVGVTIPLATLYNGIALQDE